MRTGGDPSEYRDGDSADSRPAACDHSIRPRHVVQVAHRPAPAAHRADVLCDGSMLPDQARGPINRRNKRATVVNSMLE
jgi:hypothetical protein